MPPSSVSEYLPIHINNHFSKRDSLLCWNIPLVGKVHLWGNPEQYSYLILHTQFWILYDGLQIYVIIRFKYGFNSLDFECYFLQWCLLCRMLSGVVRAVGFVYLYIGITLSVYKLPYILQIFKVVSFIKYRTAIRTKHRISRVFINSNWQ